MLGDINFDEKLRSNFSIVFRVIIVCFACYLLMFSQNAFEWYYYVLGIAIYGYLYRILRKDTLSILRLLNDFLFIFFIIYGKDYNNPAALIFILLPIINSPNHSGRSSSPFLVTALSFLLLGYLIRDTSYLHAENINLSIYIIVPIALILMIIGFELYRATLLRASDAFNHQIDSYYSENLRFIQKPYKILKNITKLINENRALYLNTSRLLCFRVRGNKLIIVGSSKFVYQYIIFNKGEYLMQLRKNEIVENFKIRIEDQIYEKNISYYIKSNEHEYVFLLITNGIHLFHNALNSVFVRFSNILIFEDSLVEQKNRYLEKLQYKMEFADNAQMAMHFIKNKLNPIRNFLKISDDLNLKSPDLEEWMAHFLREKDKANANMPLIVEKAVQFHANVENIFSLTDYQRVGIKKVIGLVRGNWNTVFSDEEIVINIDLKRVGDYSLEVNNDLLEVLLTNWISNMFKYKENLVALELSEMENQVLVKFSNDLSENRMAAAKKFVADFNSDGKAEILNRGQSQGLHELRYLIRQMEIQYRLEIIGNKVEFEIMFDKRYEKNSSS